MNIQEELLEDLVNKIASYVKSYETSLIELKKQALELIAEKDNEIKRLTEQVGELQYRVQELENVSQEESTTP